MKAIVMLGAVAFLMLAGAARSGDKPELKYEQKGDDLIVRMVVTANNSPHVLWTSVVGTGPKLTLRYYVIQNPDLFNRSQKQITIEWKLTGRNEDGTQIRVEEHFAPITADLKALAPQLEELMKAGEKRPK